MKSNPETISFIRKRRLPHWEVANGLYFVTLCQYGAIPKEAAARIQTMRLELDRLQGGAMLELERAIVREMEAWLDRIDCQGDLGRRDVAAMLMEAIDHRMKTHQWHVLTYVIMPNHLHLFIKTCEGNLFESMLQFKRWTGRQANKLIGGNGSFWAREWFDHWSRTPEEDEKIIRYIGNNPVKAGLCRNSEDWPYKG